MSRRSGFVLTTLLLLAASLYAQASVAPGTRVKLQVHGVPGIASGKPAEIRGRVVSTSGDTLLLVLEPSKERSKTANSTFAVPLDAITQLSISRGHGLRPLTGALYGGIGGVALGLSVLTLLCGEADVELGPGEGDKTTCTLSDIGGILLFTSILGVGGAVGGLVVGTIFGGGEKWQPMPTDRWRVSLRPGANGGTDVGLTLSF